MRLPDSSLDPSRSLASGRPQFIAPKLALVALVAVALLVAACSSTASSTAPGSSSSATATSVASHGGATSTPGSSSGPTATPSAPAPNRALAWYQYDSDKVPQIWASVNGATPRQITHVAPDHAACLDQVAWGLPVFSPDMTHIVTSLGSFNCGDGALTGTVSIVDVASGAVTPVPGSAPANVIRLTQRVDGWIDNSTIWYISYSGLYTYVLGAGSATEIATLHNPEDAVLRGSTLFWSTFATGGAGGGDFQLHRFDMSSHTDLGTTIDLGTVGTCACSPGDYLLPGWDASPDGSHVAYQKVTPASGSVGGIASAQFFYANADGSGASQIAHVVSTTHLATVLISPNGQLVSIAWALPSPSVITASVSSPGHSGDPNLHFYHPDAVGFAVWKWDTSSFWAETINPGDYGGPGSAGPSPDIDQYYVGTASGSLSIPNGLNPWYTIGS